jgi:hypothetical protein
MQATEGQLGTAALQVKVKDAETCTVAGLRFLPNLQVTSCPWNSQVAFLQQTCWHTNIRLFHQIDFLMHDAPSLSTQKNGSGEVWRKSADTWTPRPKKMSWSMTIPKLIGNS